RGFLDRAVDQHLPWPWERVELQRRVAALDGRARPVAEAHLLAVAGRLAVDADRGAAGATEQVVDRRVERLADHVPERDLEAREGAVEVETAALDRHVAPHHVREVLDV